MRITLLAADSKLIIMILIRFRDVLVLLTINTFLGSSSGCFEYNQVSIKKIKQD
jgi:hypothetical protein